MRLSKCQVKAVPDMIKLQPCEAWILINFLSAVSSVIATHNVVQKSRIVSSNIPWWKIMPHTSELLYISKKDQKPMTEFACISSNPNIVNIIEETKHKCLGKDYTVTFYFHKGKKYIKLDTIDIDGHLFQNILMKYPNWLLTQEKKLEEKEISHDLESGIHYLDVSSPLLDHDVITEATAQTKKTENKVSEIHHTGTVTPVSDIIETSFNHSPAKNENSNLNMADIKEINPLKTDKHSYVETDLSYNAESGHFDIHLPSKEIMSNVKNKDNYSVKENNIKDKPLYSFDNNQNRNHAKQNAILIDHVNDLEAERIMNSYLNEYTVHHDTPDVIKTNVRDSDLVKSHIINTCSTGDNEEYQIDHHHFSDDLEHGVSVVHPKSPLYPNYKTKPLDDHDIEIKDEHYDSHYVDAIDTDSHFYTDYDEVSHSDIADSDKYHTIHLPADKFDTEKATVYTIDHNSVDSKYNNIPHYSNKSDNATKQQELTELISSAPQPSYYLTPIQPYVPRNPPLNLNIMHTYTKPIQTIEFHAPLALESLASNIESKNVPSALPSQLKSFDTVSSFDAGVTIPTEQSQADQISLEIPPKSNSSVLQLESINIPPRSPPLIITPLTLPTPESLPSEISSFTSIPSASFSFHPIPPLSKSSFQYTPLRIVDAYKPKPLELPPLNNLVEVEASNTVPSLQAGVTIEPHIDIPKYEEVTNANVINSTRKPSETYGNASNYELHPEPMNSSKIQANNIQYIDSNEHKFDVHVEDHHFIDHTEAKNNTIINPNIVLEDSNLNAQYITTLNNNSTQAKLTGKPEIILSAEEQRLLNSKPIDKDKHTNYVEVTPVVVSQPELLTASNHLADHAITEPVSLVTDSPKQISNIRWISSSLPLLKTPNIPVTSNLISWKILPKMANLPQPYTEVSASSPIPILPNLQTPKSSEYVTPTVITQEDLHKLLKPKFVESPHSTVYSNLPVPKTVVSGNSTATTPLLTENNQVYTSPAQSDIQQVMPKAYTDVSYTDLSPIHEPQEGSATITEAIPYEEIPVVNDSSLASQLSNKYKLLETTSFAPYIQLPKVVNQKIYQLKSPNSIFFSPFLSSSLGSSTSLRSYLSPGLNPVFTNPLHIQEISQPETTISSSVPFTTVPMSPADSLVYSTTAYASPLSNIKQLSDTYLSQSPVITSPISYEEISESELPLPIAPTPTYINPISTPNFVTVTNLPNTLPLSSSSSNLNEAEVQSVSPSTSSYIEYVSPQNAVEILPDALNTTPLLMKMKPSLSSNLISKWSNLLQPYTTPSTSYRTMPLGALLALMHKSNPQLLTKINNQSRNLLLNKESIPESYTTLSPEEEEASHITLFSNKSPLKEIPPSKISENSPTTPLYSVLSPESLSQIAEEGMPTQDSLITSTSTPIKTESYETKYSNSGTRTEASPIPDIVSLKDIMNLILAPIKDKSLVSSMKKPKGDDITETKVVYYNPIDAVYSNLVNNIDANIIATPSQYSSLPLQNGNLNHTKSIVKPLTSEFLTSHTSPNQEWFTIPNDAPKSLTSASHGLQKVIKSLDSMPYILSKSPNTSVSIPAETIKEASYQPLITEPNVISKPLLDLSLYSEVTEAPNYISVSPSNVTTANKTNVQVNSLPLWHHYVSPSILLKYISPYKTQSSPLTSYSEYTSATSSPAIPVSSLPLTSSLPISLDSYSEHTPLNNIECTTVTPEPFIEAPLSKISNSILPAKMVPISISSVPASRLSKLFPALTLEPVYTASWSTAPKAASISSIVTPISSAASLLTPAELALGSPLLPNDNITSLPLYISSEPILKTYDVLPFSVPTKYYTNLAKFVSAKPIDRPTITTPLEVNDLHKPDEVLPIAKPLSQKNISSVSLTSSNTEHYTYIPANVNEITFSSTLNPKLLPMVSVYSNVGKPVNKSSSSISNVEAPASYLNLHPSQIEDIIKSSSIQTSTANIPFDKISPTSSIPLVNASTNELSSPAILSPSEIPSPLYITPLQHPKPSFKTLFSLPLSSISSKNISQSSPITYAEYVKPSSSVVISDPNIVRHMSDTEIMSATPTLSAQPKLITASTTPLKYSILPSPGLHTTPISYTSFYSNPSTHIPSKTVTPTATESLSPVFTTLFSSPTSTKAGKTTKYSTPIETGSLQTAVPHLPSSNFIEYISNKTPVSTSSLHTANLKPVNPIKATLLSPTSTAVWVTAPPSPKHSKSLSLLSPTPQYSTFTTLASSTLAPQFVTPLTITTPLKTATTESSFLSSLVSPVTYTSTSAPTPVLISPLEIKKGTPAITKPLTQLPSEYHTVTSNEGTIETVRNVPSTVGTSLKSLPGSKYVNPISYIEPTTTQHATPSYTTLTSTTSPISSTQSVTEVPSSHLTQSLPESSYNSVYSNLPRNITPSSIANNSPITHSEYSNLPQDKKAIVVSSTPTATSLYKLLPSSKLHEYVNSIELAKSAAPCDSTQYNSHLNTVSPSIPTAKYVTSESNSIIINASNEPNCTKSYSTPETQSIYTTYITPNSPSVPVLLSLLKTSPVSEVITPTVLPNTVSSILKPQFLPWAFAVNMTSPSPVLTPTSVTASTESIPILSTATPIYTTQYTTPLSKSEIPILPSFSSNPKYITLLPAPGPTPEDISAISTMTNLKTPSLIPTSPYTESYSNFAPSPIESSPSITLNSDQIMPMPSQLFSMTSNSPLPSTNEIMKNNLKSSLHKYLNNNEDLKSNLFNNNKEITIPIGNFLIAKNQIDKSTDKSINPSVNLKIWPSNIKLIGAKLQLNVKDLKVTNFQPFVNNLNKCNISEIENLIRNHIRDKFGDVIVLKDKHSSSNEYSVINTDCGRVSDNKCNLLWPINDAKEYNKFDTSYKGNF